MPKSKAHRHVRAYEIFRLLQSGQLVAVPLGNSRILKTLQRCQITLPPVKKRQRSIKEKRMGIPKGSYLNARWMKVRENWDIWDQIEGVNPGTENYRSLVSRGIVFIEETQTWYILIYEVVSGLSKLLRQQVHRDFNYQQERLRSHAVIRGFERRMAAHALGLAKLSEVERRELRKLEGRISRRLEQIDFIQGKLSFRKTFVFITGQEEIRALKDLQDSIDQSIAGLSQKVLLPNFRAFLNSIEEKLAILSTYDIWRSIHWARWHIRAAVENLDPLDLAECRRHLSIATNKHIDYALYILRRWDKSLSDDEMKHVPFIDPKTVV